MKTQPEPPKPKPTQSAADDTTEDAEFLAWLDELL
jgi:hypothetical protein